MDLTTSYVSRAVATGTILNEDVASPPLFNGDYSTGDFSQWAVVQRAQEGRARLAELLTRTPADSVE